MTSQHYTSDLTSNDASIFGDLPEALINELLTRSAHVSGRASSRVSKLTQEQTELRKRAHQLRLIQQLPDESPDTSPQSIAAIDGSIASFRLSAFDVNAAAALAVEGFGKTVDADARRHDFELHIIDPHPHAREIVYGLMFCMEYEMAHQAPHDLIMLDGALSTGMVGISLGLKSATQGTDDLSKALYERWIERVRDTVPQILQSDKVVAIPKRSSANEFATQTALLQNRESDADGGSVASLILEPGEFTTPFRLETHRFHIEREIIPKDYLWNLDLLYSDVKVVYFKPAAWSKALRIEIPGISSTDSHALREKLENIRRQVVNPAMLEPYPIYLADRFVKSLSKGVNALLDSVRRDVIQSSDNVQIATNMLQHYRSDPLFEETMS